MPFTLTSAAFTDGGAIPRENTCDGADVSPALSWTGAPNGAAAFVLVMDDPDAHDFVHWIVVLDHPETGLRRAVPRDDPNAIQGINGFGRIGYGGPCPPSGTHHYRFTLTALAEAPNLPDPPTIAGIRHALSTANVVAEVALTGTYRRA